MLVLPKSLQSSDTARSSFQSEVGNGEYACQYGVVIFRTLVVRSGGVVACKCFVLQSELKERASGDIGLYNL